MGIDYDSTVVVGFVVDADELLQQFLVKRKEKAHHEPRFNKKTGKPDVPEKIVDVEAGYDIVIEGKVFYGPDEDFDPENDSLYSDASGNDPELSEHLGALLDCDVQLCGDYVGGEFMAFTFEPFSCRSKDDAIPLSGVADAIAGKEFDRIKKKAKELGIDLGEAGIRSLNIIT